MDTIDKIFEKYPNAGRDSLIPILQEVQEEENFLSKEAVKRIGNYLGLPTSKIYGVATFYNQFRFEVLGEFHIQICRGTACHVKGSEQVLEEFKRELNIEPGETSRDGLFSLEVVACIGACGLAPVITVNGEVHSKVTPGDVKDIIENYREEVKENA